MSQAPQPLTDEQIEALWEPWSTLGRVGWIAGFARSVEDEVLRAHGIHPPGESA